MRRLDLLELRDLTRARLAVGIGPVDAAVGATRAIAAHGPERVIFVGTAGAYPREPRHPRHRRRRAGGRAHLRLHGGAAR